MHAGRDGQRLGARRSRDTVAGGPPSGPSLGIILAKTQSVQMGRLGAGAVGKTARTAPITNNGCQTGHLADKNAGNVSQTTPITNNGCQTGHLRPESAAKVAQTTPITNNGCQTGHLRPESAAKVAQTTPIRCTGRYSVRLHRGVPEAESPSTLAAGGPGLGSSVRRSAEHYEASWGAFFSNLFLHASECCVILTLAQGRLAQG